MAPATPASAPAARPRVRGKFLFVGDEKLYIRGVTYGAFAPDAQGNEYHDLATVCPLSSCSRSRRTICSS